MCLAGIETLFTFSFGLYSLAYNSTSFALAPWKGWADTHFQFSHVGQYPLAEWENSPIATSLDLTRWLVVACAFTFFGFFGFAEEAKRHYWIAIQYVGNRVKLPGSISSSFGTFSLTG